MWILENRYEWSIFRSSGVTSKAPPPVLLSFLYYYINVMSRNILTSFINIYAYYATVYERTFKNQADLSPYLALTAQWGKLAISLSGSKHKLILFHHHRLGSEVSTVPFNVCTLSDALFRCASKSLDKTAISLFSILK